VLTGAASVVDKVTNDKMILISVGNNVTEVTKRKRANVYSKRTVSEEDMM
jgi:hypothetical protein